MDINEGEVGAGLNQKEAGLSALLREARLVGMGLMMDRIQDLEGQLAAYERQMRVDAGMAAVQGEKRFSDGREWERRCGVGATLEVVTKEAAALRTQVEVMGTRIDRSFQLRLKLNDELAEAKSNLDNLRLEADQWRSQLKAAECRANRMSQGLYETELLLAAEREKVAAFMKQLGGHKTPISEFESAYRCGVRDVKRAMDKVEVSWKTS